MCLSWEGFDALPDDQQRVALVRAADICSMSYSEAQFTPKTWLERWKYNRTCRKWGRIIAKAIFPLEIAEFRNYLAAGRKMLPALSSAVPEDAEAYEVANKGEKLEGGRSLGSPLVAQLIPFCSEKLSLSLPEAMDMPLGFACNLYFSYLEGKGQMHIENYREAEERATLARMREEVKAEKAAAKEAWEAATTEEEKIAAIKKHGRILDLYPEAAELKGKSCPLLV